ncbi:putative serine-threonine protein kinase [Aspergillus varians]
MPGISSSYWLDFKSFRDSNGHHPSQTAIFHNNGSSWWIQVVADWSLPMSVVELGYLKRRSIFQHFIEAIDFAQLQLMDNTVTNIALALNGQTQNSIIIRDGFQNSENYFVTLAHTMCCTITEDPNRVPYPPLDRYRNLRYFEASHLQVVEVITPTVSMVLVGQHNFAYKSIDSPIYVPGDVEHVLDEIDALSQFRGHSNIAQLVGLVVSENPYKTNPSADMPPVITGFLVEYYSEGSLEQVIEQNGILDDTMLVQWALQVGEALQALHLGGRTHLDIKLSNIVLDSHKNAILIDVGGTGGYRQECLSPEMATSMQQNTEMVPTNAPFTERIATDCWAYGRIVSALAEKGGTAAGADKLRFIARRLTEAIPEARVSLHHTLAQLRNTESH